jgi:hypothetical protein
VRDGEVRARPAHGHPDFLEEREGFVVRAAAGGALGIQHHAHGDTGPGALDDGLLDLGLREGELLDDERVAGARDEVDDGADAVVRLHDEVTGLRHAGKNLLSHTRFRAGNNSGHPGLPRYS